jgi:hypothetical protein
MVIYVGYADALPPCLDEAERRFHVRDKEEVNHGDPHRT